jgi:hypothetical protein
VPDDDTVNGATTPVQADSNPTPLRTRNHPVLVNWGRVSHDSLSTRGATRKITGRWDEVVPATGLEPVHSQAAISLKNAGKGCLHGSYTVLSLDG